MTSNLTAPAGVKKIAVSRSSCDQTANCSLRDEARLARSVERSGWMQGVTRVLVDAIKLPPPVSRIDPIAKILSFKVLARLLRCLDRSTRDVDSSLSACLCNKIASFRSSRRPNSQKRTNRVQARFIRIIDR